MGNKLLGLVVIGPDWFMCLSLAQWLKPRRWHGTTLLTLGHTTGSTISRSNDMDRDWEKQIVA